MVTNHSPRPGHPPGLTVLFLTEMWERFGFYTVGALIALYLKDKEQGFGWATEDATRLYANYAMFVYASPLLGGWLADRKLGQRNSVLIGGVIFMVGYFLFWFHSLPMVYAALACIVIGNGFFKPNVSAMVGSLYPEGSPLKERAFTIFYMGINVGALLAPLVSELMVRKTGFRPAFVLAGFGMIISVNTLWWFRHLVVDRRHETSPPLADVDTAAVTEDVPPPAVRPIDAVPDRLRIRALVVIYLVVIVFWMVFHQNHTTILYWANDNTDWASWGLELTGIISAAINPFFVVTLSIPMVWFWQRLSASGLEPATPTKMVFGMIVTGLAYLILFAAARRAEATVSPESPYDYKVSPAWLLGMYATLTVAELMLSPMGLSLVAQVAPQRWRGLMMGGWFLATAIGNKLTQIGELWNKWPHSDFWLLLSGLALIMAVVLFLLLRPLKKAMPGV